MFRPLGGHLHSKTYRGVYFQSPGIWAARARKVDKAKSYNYVTRALANVKEKNVRDQKVFKVNRRANRECCLMLKLKVLLAVRRMIKAASFAFFWEMMEKHTHNQLFRYMMELTHIYVLF